jgi:hypothetical protein
VSIAIWQILGGALQLLLGRRIYWLMVGIVGFLVGLYGTMIALDMPTWLRLVVGLVIGGLFSILAVVMQKPMAAIFGFFALGLAAALVAFMLGAKWDSSILWITFLVGGVIGAILVFALFDWGLIICSSLVGAGSVVSGLAILLKFQTQGLLGVALFAVLAIIGIGYQRRYLR